MRKSLSPRGLKKLLEHDHAARIRSGVLIGRLKGKRDPVSSPPLLSPRGFRYSSRCSSPHLTRLKKYFLFQTSTSDTTTFFPFFLNVDSFQSFSPPSSPSSFVRERFHVGMKIVKMEWRGRGETLTLIITLWKRRVEEFVFDSETELPAGRVFDAAFRGESSPRWQCVGNCCSRNAAPGAKKNRSWPDALLFFSSSFFFSPPPSYNLDSYAIVHRDGHRDKLPYLRDSGWFLHESLIEEFEKRIRERERYIYITILIFFDFYEE